jgi:hypothetical protein
MIGPELNFIWEPITEQLTPMTASGMLSRNNSASDDANSSGCSAKFEDIDDVLKVVVNFTVIQVIFKYSDSIDISN